MLNQGQLVLGTGIAIKRQWSQRHLTLCDPTQTLLFSVRFIRQLYTEFPVSHLPSAGAGFLQCWIDLGQGLYPSENSILQASLYSF